MCPHSQNFHPSSFLYSVKVGMLLQQGNIVTVRCNVNSYLSAAYDSMTSCESERPSSISSRRSQSSRTTSTSLMTRGKSSSSWWTSTPLPRRRNTSVGDRSRWDIEVYAVRQRRWDEVKHDQQCEIKHELYCSVVTNLVQQQIKINDRQSERLLNFWMFMINS